LELAFSSFFFLSSLAAEAAMRAGRTSASEAFLRGSVERQVSGDTLRVL
jgi:hypothetical protein